MFSIMLLIFTTILENDLDIKDEYSRRKFLPVHGWVRYYVVQQQQHRENPIIIIIINVIQYK